MFYKVKPKIGKLLLLSLLIILIFIIGYSSVYRVAWGEIQRTDFTVYTAAAQAVLDHKNIYEAHNSRGWNYVYLPFFSILMVPFAKIDLAIGAGAWYVLSVFLLAYALKMSVLLALKVNLKKNKSYVWLWLIPLVICSQFVVSGLLRGQASSVMVFFVIAGFYFDKQNRPYLSGTSLALAVLIKVFPIALLPYFVWRKRWRCIWAFVTVFFIGCFILPASVFGWQKNIDYLSQWHSMVSKPIFSKGGATESDCLHDQLLDINKGRNQSLQSLAFSMGANHFQAQMISYSIGFMMLLVMIWILYKQPNSNVISAGSFLAWCLLIPPISESHYFGLLVLPLSILTGFAFYTEQSPLQYLAKGTLVLAGLLNIGGVFIDNFELYRPLCLMSISIWITLVTISIYSINKNRSMA